MQKTLSIQDYKLHSNFEQLRRNLLDDRFAERLEKPLAYWALPNDRRLPLAFMGRTVRDLLNTPFEELCATPGVGQKKISSLLVLLSRAAKATPPEEEPTNGHSTEVLEDDAEFVFDVDLDVTDPLEVSEAVWARWRANVVRTGFENLPLGRFAPTLQHLPRVLWHTPLSTYVDVTLGEMRSLKTHGDKRVAAVVEVFGTLNRIIADLQPQPELAVKIVPRLVSELEAWIWSVYTSHEMLRREQLYNRFIHPLLVQVRIDAGEHIEQLARRRLGLTGDATSVRQIARDLGLTRARVYQLLADIADIVEVRWPEGKRIVQGLRDELSEQAAGEGDLALFTAAVDLFFPEKPAEEEQ